MPAKPKADPLVAIGPAYAKVRGWRAWGDRPMPILRMKRRAPSWLFVPIGPRAKTGRPPVDEDEERGCHVGGRDRLLERLREAHGAP